MNTCINKQSDVLKRSCAAEKASAYTDFRADERMWTETQTKPLIFVYSIYFPAVPQTFLFLMPLSLGLLHPDCPVVYGQVSVSLSHVLYIFLRNLSTHSQN